MITADAVNDFLRENWIPVLLLIILLLGSFALLVEQAIEEVKWVREKQRRSMSEWVKGETR